MDSGRGGLEKGESDSDALIREIHEELNCECVVGDHIVSYQTGIQHIAGKIIEPYEVHSYLVKLLGTPKPGAEIEKLLWLTKDQISKIEIPPKLRGVIIPELAKRKIL